MPRRTDDELQHLRSDLNHDNELDDDKIADEDEEFDNDLPAINIDADRANADWIRYNHADNNDEKAIFEATTGQSFEMWLEERRNRFDSRGIKANMRLLTPEERQDR